MFCNFKQIFLGTVILLFISGIRADSKINEIKDDREATSILLNSKTKLDFSVSSKSDLRELDSKASSKSVLSMFSISNLVAIAAGSISVVLVIVTKSICERACKSLGKNTWSFKERK
jgi:hypothetical protein